MRNELFSASRADALALVYGRVKKHFPKLEANTVDIIKLATLALILDGKELDDADVVACTNRFEDIANQGEDGPWLFVCPREFMFDLATLRPERVPEVAATWARTEEAQIDRWTVADTREFLKSLSTFCANAVGGGRELLLFACL